LVRVTRADARRVVLAHLMTEVDDSALTHAMRLLLAPAETGALAMFSAFARLEQAVIRVMAHTSKSMRSQCHILGPPKRCAKGSTALSAAWVPPEHLRTLIA
jgi:hypothetical protein